MSEIFKVLLSEKISVQQLIDWLRCEEQTENPSFLKELDSIKSVFIPFFLNYLREQTSSLVQASHSETITSLTPNKTPIKTKTEVKAPANTRRMRLFAQQSEKENSCNLNISVDEANDQASHTKNDTKKYGNWKKDGQRKHNEYHKNHRKTYSAPLESTPRHKQKMTFGQYISVVETPKEKHHSYHGDENFKSDSYGMRGYKSEIITAADSEKNVIGVNDLQSFPPIGMPADLNTRKNKVPKRIKPTLLKTTASSNSSVFFEQKQPGNAKLEEQSSDNIFKSLQHTKVPGNLSEERELLRQEKMKWSQNRNVLVSNEVDIASAFKANVQIKPLQKKNDVILPLPDQATFQTQLLILASLYSSFISYNLVSNISVELYFIFQLLTLRYQPQQIKSSCFDSDIDDVMYFSTVHNCVFFAISVLNQKISLLRCLDMPLIKMLMDLTFIETFSSELKSKLQQICDDKSKVEISSAVSVGYNISGVSFQADTDNQNNFLTDASFRSFRKQRDLFYEIIRLWEDNHLNCGWTLAEGAGNKIKSAVDMRMDPISYSHFARLFVNQLIVMCKGQRLADFENQLENYEDLAHLIKANPEKMKKLQDRLVKPNHAGGLCPPPSFQGHQEFFKDFILVAQSPYFIQHLIDHLTFRIHELNDVQFNIAEDHQTYLDNYEEIQEHFYDVFQTLRILAKFLGFVVFLPYRTSQKMTEHIMTSEIAIRSKVNPPIDLLMVISNAVVRQRKVLVIPWVVEFLSMMDNVAPSLDFYHKLLSFIVFIYRMVLNSEATTHSDLLVLSLLGWLFQTPNFPETLLYQQIADLKSHKTTLLKLTSTNDITNKLDELNLVNQHILYACCPFLRELRMLISEFNSGTRNSSDKEVRKITPVTNSDKLNTSKQERDIQVKLEENFFHNQPTSLKKTVDFIADRIASNAIKHIRDVIIPKIRSDCCQSLKILVDQYELNESEELNKTQDVFKQEIDLKANGACERANADMINFTHQYIKKQNETLLSMLLPEDTSEQVIKTCSKINTRISINKITNWSIKYVTIDYFTKELMFECDKLWKQKLLNKSVALKDSFSVICTGCHDYGHPSPSELIMQAQDMIKRLNNDQIVTSEELCKFLDCCNSIQSKRDDVTLVVVKTICFLIAEILIAIVSKAPKLWNGSMEKSIKEVWCNDIYKSSASYNAAITSIISLKSIVMLSKCLNRQLSWAVYNDIIKMIIQEKYIDPICLTKQIDDVSLYHWPPDVMENVDNLKKLFFKDE